MSSQIKASSIFRAFSFFKPYRWILFLSALAGVIRFAVPLMVPWGIKIIMDEVLMKPGPEARILLIRMLGAVSAGYVIWIGASYARLYLTGYAGNKMIVDLRRSLYRHLQRMPLDFFEKIKIGGVVSRMTHDLSAVQQILNQGVTAAVIDLISVLVITGIMFSIHGKLALISSAAVPLYVWLSHSFIRKIRGSSRGVQEQMEKLSGGLVETFSGITLVRSFCREAAEEEKFSARSRSHMEAVLRNAHFQALGLSLTGFLSGMIPVGILGYGAFQVLGGSLTAGELVAFYVYVGLLYMPVTRLAEMNVMIGGGLAALDRVFEVLDQDEEAQEENYASEMKTGRSDICFQKVSFSYPGGTEVFDSLELTIREGECVAVTGESGAGKSTLVKLLLRFCEASDGTLFVGGQDVRDLKLSSLRAHIAWVPQEPILLSGSILENILYGREGATAQEAIQAARAAHAHDFILTLPHQYETQVGEKGTLLSAGEKQRIAIARAFLKNAPILILDEPSSALDENSESLIRKSFKELRKGKTVLMISHRHAMAEDADRMVRLEKGRALEKNTPFVKR